MKIRTWSGLCLSWQLLRFPALNNFSCPSLSPSSFKIDLLCLLYLSVDINISWVEPLFIQDWSLRTLFTAWKVRWSSASSWFQLSERINCYTSTSSAPTQICDTCEKGNVSVTESKKLFLLCSDPARTELQGVFFNWYPPKKYGKPRLGVSTLT